jgi:non-canonical (house-cleaning) NTP pyrophosphatase
MKFLIGTNNKQKVAVAREVIEQMLHGVEFTLNGHDVASGYGETPIAEETKLGAYNRAVALLSNHECDYAIGIESGLVSRYGDTYEEAWCCIITTTGAYYGYSSGLKVPDILTQKMKAENVEHFEALRDDEIKKLLPEKEGKDTWTNYSGRMIARRISFEESLRNTLVQIFAPDDSLYHR